MGNCLSPAARLCGKYRARAHRDCFGPVRNNNNSGGTAEYSGDNSDMMATEQRSISDNSATARR
jgi:hypothetical protein